MKKQLIFGHIATLLVGGLIYLLFRTSSLKMFEWYNTIGLGTFTNKLRVLTLPFAYKIPDWILYSLPDGLWIFSYISLILFIWQNKISKNSLFWILLIPFIAISSEIGQLFRIVPGTFDLTDIILYLIGITTPFLIFTNFINQKKKIS